MMAHQITLLFADGVTQTVECGPDERITDAAFRAKINIPADCRTGACGTCKAVCVSGTYALGDCVQDALSAEEAAAGYVLACQMSPLSDCVIQIATESDAGYGAVTLGGRLAAIDAVSSTALTFSIELENRADLAFHPGQYANVTIPGTDQTRSYSFSSGPTTNLVSFLVRNVPGGQMSAYLGKTAKVGDPIRIHGPLGGFYLRPIERPVLFLAGGTGLAPFLAMLDQIVSDGGSRHAIHLIFGVTNDEDLACLDRIEAYRMQLSNFTYVCTVANDSSAWPNKGFVTQHITAAHLNEGNADVYVCGPPPMVDAVRDHLTTESLVPRNFHYEKFVDTRPRAESPGEPAACISPTEIDDALDLRMALELGAAQMVMGRLSTVQLIRFRQLAEGTGPSISHDRVIDLPGYIAATDAFHQFLIEASGSAQFAALSNQFPLRDYIGRLLRTGIPIVGDPVEEHRAIVAAFELCDIGAASEAISRHTHRSKATMSRAFGLSSAARSLATGGSNQGCEPVLSPSSPSPSTPLPPYSHELGWPEGLSPFQVLDTGSQGDPYDHYRWMREHAPVLRCQTPGSDVWFLSRYDDVYQALRNPKLFSSEVVSPPPLTFFVMFDAPDHTRLRKVVQPAFMPLALDRYVDRIMDRASDLLDAMIAKGGGDVVNEFATPLSIFTISMMVDIPVEDEERIKFWSDETFSYFGRLARNAAGTGTDEQSAKEFFAYLKIAMEKLAVTDSQSIGGHIARMWKQGLLSEKEAKELCAFIFIAGHDTTTILISNAFRMLAEQPHLLERIRDNQQDADRFVEEVARYRGTVQRVSRMTTEAVTIAGVDLPKGAIVRLLVAAGNRDDRKFDNGETFDIDRDTRGHLGFGNGMHACLGAPLAKLETLISTKLAARRLRTLALDPTRPIQYVAGKNLSNAGPEKLYVTMR